MRRQLGSYLDQESLFFEREAVEAHLKACPACRAELEELQALYLLLEEPEPLPAAFTLQVLERVELERPKGLLWPWLRGKWSETTYSSLAYALTAALVVGVGFRYLSGGPQIGAVPSLWDSLGQLGGQMNGFMAGGAIYLYEMVKVVLS